ncbi:MAG: hypothetical protein KC425_10230 [Anaerolineales bacterium]|nr:hypothetical protein [Anaerolineales bacterium]
MLNTIISRVRRNHGLEHATIHMLTAKHTNFSAQGNSDYGGFSLNVYGDVDEEAVRAAVLEAYRRMKAGEHHLAVHPNCGTVLLTTATMATLAAQAAVSVEQRRQRSPGTTTAVLFNALPSAIMSVVIALILSRPLGVQLQALYTVEGDLKEMEIVSIRRVRPNVITRIFQFLLTGGRPGIAATAYRVTTKN